MTTRHPRAFHAALRALSQEIWRSSKAAPVVRTPPAGTLHGDLSWSRHAARLLLSPRGEAAVVSAHDPQDFLAYQRPPSVQAGIPHDLRRLDVWHVSDGHRAAYVEMAALPDQAARDAWAAAFVAGPLNASIANPEDRFLPPGRAPEAPNLTCAQGTPEELEALLTDVLVGLGGEGDLVLVLSLDPESETPFRLDGAPTPDRRTTAAVRRAAEHLLQRFRPSGTQLHYNDGAILLQGGYYEGQASIEIELDSRQARTAHQRQQARDRLAAAGVPL